MTNTLRRFLIALPILFATGVNAAELKLSLLGAVEHVLLHRALQEPHRRASANGLSPDPVFQGLSRRLRNTPKGRDGCLDCLFARHRRPLLCDRLALYYGVAQDAGGAGHDYFTFNDSYFRIILLRAMAWTVRKSFDPFKPLVTLRLQR